MRRRSACSQTSNDGLVGKASALEELAPQARQRHAFDRVAADQHVQVDETDGVAVQCDGLAPQAVGAQGVPQLAQVPAQRRQRVVGLLEQHAGQMRPADGARCATR